MEIGIDPKHFEFAVSKIENGFVFEEFSSRYLSCILDYSFTIAGGIRDRCIDGLEHIFFRNGFERRLYQASIEKNSENKIKKSLKKLKDNKIEFERFCFITNKIVKNQDILVDQFYDEYGKPIYVYDLKWLSSRVNQNEGTIRTYQNFVETYLHDFTQPGKSYVIGDLIDDPRLYVFLRQQWDHDKELEEVDEILTDTLILFALEGTNPDKDILFSKSKIKEIIASKISFDPKVLDETIDKRLSILSTKPRRIKYHPKQEAYCLPYETRLEIQARNFDDAELHQSFLDETIQLLRQQLHIVGIRVKDCLTLMESAINQIYYQQGLEFADFILKGENQDAFEKDIYDTISNVVESSSVIPSHWEEVKAALMITIREIVYNGTQTQKLFLQKLSNTYLMLFLLQCDPKLGLFFGSLASKLNIYVCTSLLIPAMSEIYLDDANRRHWNLLKTASIAGVKLIVNDTILKELISHFNMLIDRYVNIYKPDEDVYISNEINTLYIDQIMIRAYYYAKIKGKVNSFENYIDNFITPDLRHAKEELIVWLKEEFCIEYRSDEFVGVTINKDDYNKLYVALKEPKHSDAKAATDARLILTIYAIREKNNEAGSSDIFGYRTWWLSKDTLTMRTANQIFKDKYRVSCYMRPDFLLNYISLAPSQRQIKASYKTLFPSLLGVNLSYHLSTEVIDCVHKCMSEHRTKNLSRRTAILQRLAEQLKVDPNARSRTYIKHFLETELKKIEVEEKES